MKRELGICLPVSAVIEGRPESMAKTLMQAGYEYIELALAEVAGLADADFNALVTALAEDGVRAKVCNVFMPGTIKITGENADLGALGEYIDRAFPRAAKLGVEMIGMGSSGSRNVPEGFSADCAWTQIVDALRLISDKAKPYGFIINVEPLNTKESNIIISLLDGQKMVQDVARDNIQLLADYFHMGVDGEDVGHVAECGHIVRHLHFADPEGRGYPKEAKPEFKAFFESAQNCPAPRASLECGGKMPEDALAALPVMRALMNK